jgi:hypothetical protein
MRLILSLLLCAPLLAWAQGDPLKSAACASALEALQAARAAPRAAGRVEDARRTAAQACLGADGEPPSRPGRVARPPIAVPAPTIEPPPGTALRNAPAPPPAPVEIPRPATITSCDAHGCWTSEGTRLPRTGPGLIGPGGPCAAQGAFAYCP